MLISTEICPTVGSQPSRTAKMYLRISARKKIGIEIPKSETPSETWSNSLPCFLAAKNPSGIPIRIEKSAAATDSSTVAGKRCPISVNTGWRLVIDVPSWSCAVSFRYRQYCT